MEAIAQLRLSSKTRLGLWQADKTSRTLCLPGVCLRPLSSCRWVSLRALVLLPFLTVDGGEEGGDRRLCHRFPLCFFDLCFSWGVGNPYELLGMRMEPHFCLQSNPVQALDAAYGEDCLVLIYGEGVSR